MKKIMFFIVLASFVFFGEASAMNAIADEIEPNANYVLLHHMGPQDGALPRMLIVPKSLKTQPAFLLHKEQFLAEFLVEEKVLDEITGSLQKQKDGWGICDPMNDSKQVGTYSVRWVSAAGNGSLCVARNDAISMFESLVKISASAEHKELNMFVNAALDSIR